mgnify:CR=1 FL=1
MASKTGSGIPLAPRWLPLMAQRLYAVQVNLSALAVGGGGTEHEDIGREVADYPKAQLWWITRDMTTLAIDTARDWMEHGEAGESNPPSSQGVVIWAGGIDLDVELRYSPFLRSASVTGLYWDIVDNPPDGVEPGLHYWLLSADAALLEDAIFCPVATVNKWSMTVRQKQYVDALLRATWALSKVRTVSERRNGAWDERADGLMPRALAKAMRDRDDPDVRLVYVRNTDTGDDPTGRTNREYSHRWIVRGHYLNQAYGVRWSKHRKIWIPPYVKGPSDKPLKRRPSVNVLAGGKTPVD